MISELPFEKAIRELERQLEALEAEPDPTPATKEAVRNLRLRINQERRQTFENLDPWNIVKYVARNLQRPQTLDYIELVFDEFIELHGDRAFGDDRAI
ncbi:MAG TPA: acetyl-CoA carboxylase carboxyl transferase subunit alpha, partial [Planctomycetaceae bacterium]|nr:acetyl-CoA carboxylase carboxyl transferase subunit alpha [Planctomycetaceae bacterium]